MFSGYPSSNVFPPDLLDLRLATMRRAQMVVKNGDASLAQSVQNHPKNKSSGFILKMIVLYLEIILYNPQVLFGKIFLFMRYTYTLVN